MTPQRISPVSSCASPQPLRRTCRSAARSLLTLLTPTASPWDRVSLGLRPLMRCSALLFSLSAPLAPVPSCPSPAWPCGSLLHVPPVHPALPTAGPVCPAFLRAIIHPDGAFWGSSLRVPVPHQSRRCLLSAASKRLLSRFLSSEKIKVGGIRFLLEITPEVRSYLLPARSQDQHGWQYSPRAYIRNFLYV